MSRLTIFCTFNYNWSIYLYVMELEVFFIDSRTNLLSNVCFWRVQCSNGSPGGGSTLFYILLQGAQSSGGNATISKLNCACQEQVLAWDGWKSGGYGSCDVQLSLCVCTQLSGSYEMINLCWVGSAFWKQLAYASGFIRHTHTYPPFTSTEWRIGSASYKSRVFRDSCYWECLCCVGCGWFMGLCGASALCNYGSLMQKGLQISCHCVIYSGM